MAMNRKPEPNQHESSSSDDGEESINEEDSDTESESEPEQQFAIKPYTAENDLITPSKQQLAGPQSSSDEDSDEDSQPRRLKSIKSEPEKASEKSTSQPIPAAKRSADGDADGDGALKKPKKEGDVGVAADATQNKVGEDSKKQYFQRLFSEEDEVAILEGLIQYKAKKGIDPNADMTGFHEFIKNDLHVDVNKVQISEKVRRFKQKFERNSVRSVRKFSNPHEQKQFELSKQIWSVEANGGAGVDSTNAKPKKKAILDVVTSVEIGKKSVEEMILGDGLELVDGAKKLELQEKWKQLKAEEIKVYLKRLRLMQEQAEAVLLALQ